MTAPDFADRLAKLASLDWRFPDYNAGFLPTSVHNLHWYPAPFVPHIPSILTSALSAPGDLILDPFAGSGVTLMEAAKLSRRAFGFDINPVAVEIATAKMLLPSTLTETNLVQFRKELAELKKTFAATSTPKSTSLDRWFHPTTAAQILALKAWAGRADGTVYKVLKVLLSSILHRSSSQRRHFSYIVDNCYPRTNELAPHDAFALFEDHLIRMTKAATLLSKNLQNSGLETDVSRLVTVKQGDARALPLPDESVDLLVTSPPYFNVNDYVKSQRLTYLLFPPFPEMDDRLDIGARRKRHKPSAAADYIREMTGFFIEAARVLRIGAHMCLVLGETSSSKARAVLPEMTEIAAEIVGPGPLINIERPIVFRKIQNRGIGTERIMVFRKQ